MWKKGSVPRFQLFLIFLNFYCSDQTLVNDDLPISCGLVNELPHSTSNWFGVVMWFTLWVPIVFKVFQCTFGTSIAKKALSTTNCKITIFSSTSFVTSNVKIHCHAMVHPCAKFEAIWTMFVFDMVMIHHICLACNAHSTMLFIFVKRCVNHLL